MNIFTLVNLKKFSVFFSFLIILSTSSVAQISLTATGGTTSASYATLTATFAAINSGTHTGVITINLTGNTTETASAVLNGSGTGSASYSSIKVMPSGGAARTITGGISGNPLIDLNGADNVSINGLNTGGNSLTIQNTTAAATATSTIRFINDAKGNIVQNCTVLGSTTSTVAGVIYFSTAIASGTPSGNDQDTISNCIIDASATGLPTRCIHNIGTATAGLENSGIVIINNSIANFFSATAVSYGIFASTGATGWTLSGNKIYQAAARAYTAAIIPCGISIASGEGYTISGNTIGYSSATATGTYAMTSSAATRFVGMNLTLAATGTNSVINNNTIANISLTGTGVTATLNGMLCGINLVSGNATISGNTIGATTGTGSLTYLSSAALGAVVGIHTSSAGTVAITNNSLGAFTSSGSALTIAGSILAINVSSAHASITVKGNTIGNATPNNMYAGPPPTGTSTANNIVVGINSLQPSLIANYSNNVIQNFTSLGTGTTGFARGIYTGTVANYTSSYTIDSNIVSNLSTNSAFVGLSNGTAAAIGIHSNHGLNTSVSYNTISGIYCLNNAATTHVIATGISASNLSGVVIKNNTIFDIRNAGIGTSVNGPPVAAGITIRSGTNTCTVVNNMISLGAGQSTNTCFIGIFANHGSSPHPADFIYYNSINIEGTAVNTGKLPSFGFMRGNFAVAPVGGSTLDIRNNIFNNTRYGDSCRNYAVGNFWGATTVSASGWGMNASNNNVLNADSSSIGYWGADMTFATWKTTVECDTFSYSRIPVTFVSNTNLHLNMGTNLSSIESGGATIPGFSNDIDFQNRPGPTTVNGGGQAPDIGCDEYDGYPKDVLLPVISNPFIQNTASTANRTLTNFATITDFFTGYYSGINTTSGTRPRIYYKKSTDNNAFTGNTSANNGWKWVQASNTSSPFSFTIDNSILTGGSVSTGDVIQYFVVAQDQAAAVNIASNPAIGFSGTTVANITSAPTSPNTYVIATHLGSTTFSVGTGQTYTSLTGANGIFKAINNAVLAGNTTINITSDLSEDGTNALNANGMGVYSLTIQSSAATLRVISNTTDLNQAMIRIIGAPNASFDGRFSGSGQFLRIVNTHTSGAACMPAISISEGSTGTTIRNCILETNDSNATHATIFVGNGVNSLNLKGSTVRDAQGTPGTPGVPYAAVHSNSIYNSVTIGGPTVAEGNAIYNFTNFGLNFKNIANSALVQNNNFYQTSGRITTFFPVSIQSGSNHTVSNNNIYQTSGTDSCGFVGIYIVGGGTGHTINNNSIGGSNANRTGAAMTFTIPVAPGPYYVSGIYLAAGSTPASNIQGNYFSNIGNVALGPVGSGAAGAHVFAINVSTGSVNIGTTAGNIIGGGATASDTIVNGYDNGMINYAGTDIVDIQNNTIGNVTYYSGGGDRNSGITILGNCKAIIKNNNIHDILSNSIDVGLGTQYSPMGICVVGALSGNSTIEGNTIYNITNTNPGIIAYQSVGLLIFGTCDSTTTVKRNRIYNINTSVKDTVGGVAKAIGIYCGAASSATYSNNQVSIGVGAINQTLVYGIMDNSTGTNKFFNNSVYINGTTTAGATNSYAFIRNSTSKELSYNNIYYNERTNLGSGQMFAAGVVSATNTATSTSNNNLLISTRPAAQVQYTGVGMDLASWKILALKDLSSLADTTASVPSSNLFVSTATGNLNIQPGNTECWWSNGMGLALTGIGDDYGSSAAVRSTSILTGGTDIGSDEFTPSVIPPNLKVTGTHAVNSTETFTFAGKTIASVTWGPLGTLPSLSTHRFYSGTWPNDVTNNGTVTGATYFNSYLSFATTGGSTYSYDLVLNYDSALTGTITTETNTVLAKKQVGVNGTWTLYGGAVNTTSNTITVSGLKSLTEFTGSEILTPLGPLALSNNNISSSQNACSGTTPATITGSTPIGGVGSYAYSWLSSTTSATTGFTVASGASANQSYSPGALTVTTWYRRVVNAGGTDTSAPVTITVNAIITSNTITASQTICSGILPATLAGSTPSGGGGGYSYQWLISTTSSTSGYSAITGATAINYAPPAITATSWYRRLVTTSSCADTSSSIQITVNAAITSNTISSAQTLCLGVTPSGLTGTTPSGGGSSTYNYQWLISTTSSFSGFTPISGATSINYTTGAITITSWYKRVVSTSSCSDTSASIAITMIAGISNNSIFSAQIICSGSTPFALTGSAPTGGGGSYTYQWLQSTTGVNSGYSPIAGATSGAGYNTGALTATTWYRRLVNSVTSGCPDTSAAIEITVNPLIGNNVISSAQTLCSGSIPATLTGSSPTGGGGGYSYQWLSSLSGPSSGFNVLGGATGANYSPGALSQNVWYRRMASTLTCLDTSAAVMITVHPKITSNSFGAPQDVCFGTVPALLTGSTPLGGNGTFGYQWISSTTGTTSGFSAVTGATAINYAPPALPVSTWFRRIVNSASCTDTSAPIRILVNPVIGSNTISASQSICSGATPTPITGSAPTGGGGGYTYRWLESTTSATSGYTPIAGGILIGLAPGPLTTTTWYRRIVITSTCFDTSAFVKVTVNPLPDATITGSIAVCSGSTMVYSVPSQSSVTHIWTITGGTISSGAGTNSITVVWGAAGAGSIGITINTTGTGCSSTSSKNITINPTPAPSASGNLTVCSGTSHAYTTPNTGNTYTWTVTGGTISSGQNTNTINVTWGTGSSGKVMITETLGICSDSSTKTVTINLTPSVPVITLNAGILSITPLAGATYQWFKDGNLLPGATNTSFHASINNGVYTVTVTSNGCGTTSSGFIYVSSGINKPASINGFSIYPNPTEGVFNVSLNLQNEISLQIIITDALGRVIQSMDAGKYSGEFVRQIDLTSFAKGVYFISVETGEGKIVGRVVKE